MKHLLVDISGHGFGHFAQVAPVLRELKSRNIYFHITVRSALPKKLLKTKISFKFDYICMELDTGMIMKDAMSVNEKDSYNWYQQFHDNYRQRLSEHKKLLELLKPDLLFADIPYISLDAAHSIGIPSIALCSLNWADIFYSYCKNQPKSDLIYKQIIDAYNKADLFIQPIPSMDMPNITKGKKINPISQQGTRRKLSTYSQSSIRQKYVLVSLGGIEAKLDTETLPEIENVTWIVPNNMSSSRKDIFQQSIFKMPYIDLISSVDLLLTKTGYGALVEAMTHQIPVLCIERPDWPEEYNLFSWCRKHGNFDSLKRDQLNQKILTDRIQALLPPTWRKPPIKANGAHQTADILAKFLV